MESKILELQKMVSKYKTTWSQIQEQMNEFTLVYVARWRGKDGKRYASPFKTKDSAEKRAKELRTQGNSEVSVTQDTLKGNIKWAKDNGPDIKGMQKEAIVEDDHTDVPSSKTMAEALRQVRESNPMGYTVKFANSKGAKIATAWYKDEADAKKALEMIKKNGGNGIISKGRMDEETIVEDGHEDVSSSKRMAQVIAEDAQLILQELNKKSNEESLPTWWTNKLATSAHNMNAARDYITNDIKEDIKEARWEIEGRVSYKGVSSEDGFHMVIDAPNEDAAERKAYDELDKARQRRKIGPGGGGSIDDADIESIEKTTDRIQAPTTGAMMNSYDPTQKEEVHPHVKKMVKDGESDENIKKMHPKTTDKDLEKLKETHMSTAKAQNQKQKEVGGEKEPIKTPKNEWKTCAMMAAELRENNKADKGKKEQEAGEDTRDSKQKTMTGQTATSPEMNPKVDYKY